MNNIIYRTSTVWCGNIKTRFVKETVSRTVRATLECPCGIGRNLNRYHSTSRVNSSCRGFFHCRFRSSGLRTRIQLMSWLWIRASDAGIQIINLSNFNFSFVPSVSIVARVLSWFITYVSYRSLKFYYQENRRMTILIISARVPRGFSSYLRRSIFLVSLTIKRHLLFQN